MQRRRVRRSTRPWGLGLTKICRNCRREDPADTKWYEEQFCSLGCYRAAHKPPVKQYETGYIKNALAEFRAIMGGRWPYEHGERGHIVYAFLINKHRDADPTKYP